MRALSVKTIFIVILCLSFSSCADKSRKTASTGWVSSAVANPEFKAAVKDINKDIIQDNPSFKLDLSDIEALKAEGLLTSEDLAALNLIQN